MTAEGYIALASLGLNIIVIVFLIPMRRSMSKVEELETKIDALNIENLRADQRRFAARLIELEKSHVICQTDLPRSYVTKTDLLRSEEHRDRRFDGINDKLDDAALKVATVAAKTDAINAALESLFRLWNKEHERKTP